MKRAPLSLLCGSYHTFTARFVRCGLNKLGGNKTALLRNVRLKDSPEVLADHLWVVCDSAPLWHRLSSGAQIELTAQPRAYLKGRPHDESNPQRMDYTLGGLKDVRVASKASKRLVANLATAKGESG